VETKDKEIANQIRIAQFIVRTYFQRETIEHPFDLRTDNSMIMLLFAKKMCM
jgi:hypothetical protein